MYDAIAVKIISLDPTTGFRQLYIQDIPVMMFTHSCGHAKQWLRNSTTIYTAIVTIQRNLTGVICRVVTPKDSERIFTPLQKNVLC